MSIKFSRVFFKTSILHRKFTYFNDINYSLLKHAYLSIHFDKT